MAATCVIFVMFQSAMTRNLGNLPGRLASTGKLLAMPDHSFLRIALPVPLPRAFDYLPPAGHYPAAPDIGRRVKVPFGSRELIGIVVETGQVAEDGPELRRAIAFLDDGPLLQGELLESLHWLSRYTHAPLGEVLGTALPVLLRQGEPMPDTHAWAWRLTAEAGSQVERMRNGTRPRRLAELLQISVRDEDSLDLHLEDWRSAARALAKRGLADRRLAVGESPKIYAPTLWRECNDQSHCRVDSPDRFNGCDEIRVWSDEDHMWWFWGRSAPMSVRPCSEMAVDRRVGQSPLDISCSRRLAAALSALFP